jgi:hypothetical protein
MPNKVFKLVIDVDSRKAKRGAKETETAFGKLNKAVQQYGKYAALAGAASAAMFARKSIQAAIAQAQAVAQVDAAIRSTGMSAGFTTQELEAMSAALQRNSIYGDEAILKMQSLLLTFKTIKGDEFARTTQAVADLAIRMGSLESAALLLGKALDDPARRASELSRSGIVLSQSQQRLIKQFEAVGERAKAQAIILAEVETQFGGAARAAADAAGGGLKQFSNALGDIMEHFGAGLVEQLDRMAKSMTQMAAADEAARAAENLGQALGLALASGDPFAGVMMALGDEARELAASFVPLERSLKVNEQRLAASADKAALLADKFRVLNGLMPRTHQQYERFVPVVEGAATAIDRMDAATEEMLAEMGQQGASRLDAVTEAIQRHEDALSAIEDKYRADIDAIRDFYAELAQLEGQLDGMTSLTDELFGYKGGAGGGAWEETIDGMIDEFTESVMGSKPEGAVKVFAGTLKDNVGSALAGAVGVALGGGSTDAIIGAFAAAIGAAVGQALTVAISASMGAAAGPIGMIGGALVGALMGKLLGSVFGGDDGGSTKVQMGFGSTQYLTGTSAGVRELVDDFNSLKMTMESLQKTIGGNIELTESFNVAQMENGRVWLNLFNELGQQVGSIEFGSIDDAISAGMARVLSSAIIDAEGPMTDAITQVFANASARGYEQTLADVELLSDLDGALGGFSLAADSMLQQIEAVRQAIERMGLEAATAAPLLEKVAEAQKDQMRELRAGALGDLADLLERAGIRQMEADRFRAQVEQQLFQLQLKKLEAEFRALDMWSDFLEGIFSDLTKFASKVGNFMDQASDMVLDLNANTIEYDDWKDNMLLAVQAAYDFIAGFEKQGFALTAYRLKRQFQEWERRLREAGGQAQKVNDAVDALWKAYDKALKQAWEAVLEPLRNFQEEMLQGSLSTRSLQQKFFGARSKFYELLERARGGDTDAIQELAQAGGQYLELARQMFGTTDRYKQIFDEVYRLIDGILEDEDLMKTAMEFQHEEMMELLELNGASANELAQMQVDELVRIRVVLEGHTRMIQNQTSALERLEVAA